MKKTLLIISIATVMGLAVAIFFIYFTKGDDNIFYKIPNYSKSVLIIDVPAISKKLLLDGFGKDNKSLAQLSKTIPDSLAAINWDESGLDLFNKLALFTIEDSDSVALNFIIGIKDFKKYHLFIDGLSSNFHFSIQKKDNTSFAYWKSLAILIAWNKDFVSCMKTDKNSIKNQTILKNILETTKNQSIMSDIDFAQKLKKSYDMLLYSKPYIKNPVKTLEILNSNIQNMAFYIDFSDGYIETTLELKTKPTSIFTKLLSPQNKDFYFIDAEDTCTLNISLNVDPCTFSQIFNQYSTLQFKDKEIPYLKAWNGELNLQINGFKTIENEFTTYDFDDNFNKIEIKKTKQDKVLNLNAVANYRTDKLDSIFKTTKPVKEAMDTLLFKGSNFVLNKNANYFLSYNKQFTKPVLAKKITESNVLFYADCKKLMTILEEFGIGTNYKYLKNNPINKFEISINQSDEINMKAKFYFIDGNKNSLFTLIDYFQKN